ncbi:hypothetical protein [Streptomyces sp. NPDC101455]|uniref:hypothetical protein n=1 Tax=Streptomyces sp. NPDC101455 TaxID=3366142 RepID=UPI00381BC67E
MTTRKIGTRLGSLEERVTQQQSELAERFGVIMANFIDAVLGDLELTDAQREIASEAVPRLLKEAQDAIARGGTE